MNPTVVTWSWESHTVDCYGRPTDRTKTYQSEWTVTNPLALFKDEVVA